MMAFCSSSLAVQTTFPRCGGDSPGCCTQTACLLPAVRPARCQPPAVRRFLHIQTGHRTPASMEARAYEMPKQPVLLRLATRQACAVRFLFSLTGFGRRDAHRRQIQSVSAYSVLSAAVYNRALQIAAATFEPPFRPRATIYGTGSFRISSLLSTTLTKAHRSPDDQHRIHFFFSGYSSCRRINAVGAFPIERNPSARKPGRFPPYSPRAGLVCLSFAALPLPDRS